MGTPPHLPLHCTSSASGHTVGAPSMPMPACYCSPSPCVLQNSNQILSQTPLPSLTQHPSTLDPKVQGPSSFGLYYSSWGARSLVHPHRHPPRTRCGHRRVSLSKWLRRMGDFRLLTEDLAQWGTWTRLGGPWGPGAFPNPQLHLNLQRTLTSKPLPWPAKPLTTASSVSLA